MADAGIASPEDQLKILQEVLIWKNEAARKYLDAAQEKGDRLKFSTEREERYMENKEKFREMRRELRVVEQRQAKEIKVKE